MQCPTFPDGLTNKGHSSMRLYRALLGFLPQTGTSKFLAAMPALALIKAYPS